MTTAALPGPSGSTGPHEVPSADELDRVRVAPQSRSKPARWVALDLARFCAVFLMLQGHVFTSLLSSSYDGERWLRHHNFVHGTTAPMFLFSSGLAFGYTTFHGWRANTTVGPALRKRLARYMWLLVIGYGLQLPAIELARLVAIQDEATWRSWLRVDVLQHIGVSLAILQGLAVLARREAVFVGFVALLFLVGVFAAPWLWTWDAQQFAPLGIANYLTSRDGSLFPLAPWAAFTYAGVLVAYAARHAKHPSRDLAWPLLGLTVACFVVPIGLNRAGFQPYGPHDFWKTDPYYFFFRLANVLTIVTAWCFAERIAEARGWLVPSHSGPSWRAKAIEVVRTVGAESLLIYVVHLVLLHGSIVTTGLATRTGRTLGLAHASGIAIALFGAMVATALLWHRLKEDAERFQLLKWGMVAAVAVLMITGRP